MTGPLEETNKSYAVAKIAGIVMCQGYNTQYGTNFISVMPTNLYGPRDNFDPLRSHVIPALLRKFHEAKKVGLDTVEIWGTGSARREFMHADYAASACLFLMQNYDDGSLINIGTGEDISIRDLTEEIKKIVEYKGDITWDATKPDGMLKKLLDVTKLQNLGWRHTVPLREGIASTYQWYKERH